MEDAVGTGQESSDAGLEKKVRDFVGWMIPSDEFQEGLGPPFFYTDPLQSRLPRGGWRFPESDPGARACEILAGARTIAKKARVTRTPGLLSYLL